MRREFLRFACFFYISFYAKTAWCLDNYDVFDVKGCIEVSVLNIPEINTIEIATNNDDVKYLSQAISILNTTTSSSKSVLTLLNELSQHNNIQYDFIFVGEEGPAHSKTFQVQLKLGNEVYVAEGKTKKSAKQLAASYALERTNYRSPPVLSSEEIKNLNTPTVQLNNIAQQLALKVNYENIDKSGLRNHYGEHSYDGKSRSVLLKLNHTYDELVDDTSDRHPVIYKVIVEEKEYYGIGHTAQDAKHAAAKSALDSMKQKALEEHNFCSNEGYEEECKLKKESLKSPISKVYETGQKLKLDVHFDIIKEKGKDHKKIFVMECKLGHLSVTAEGTSKKEAKRLAAELMLERIDELPGSAENDYSVILKTKKKKKKSKPSNKVVQNLKSLGESAVDGLSSLWEYVPTFNTEDTEDEKEVPNENQNEQKPNHDHQSNNQQVPLQKDTFKSDILHLSGTYNIQIDYKDLGKKDNYFYSQLSLDTKPKYLCFGRGDSLYQAENLASLRGMRLLQKLGFSLKNLVLVEEATEDSGNVEDMEQVWVRTKPEPAEDEKGL